MTTLHAYREDGTEVLPGDPVTMPGVSPPHTFRAAIAESNDAGTLGMIAVDGYPEMYASPYGLTVRAVPEPDEPAWDIDANTGRPCDIRRDIRGPGGFYAVAGPGSGGYWYWAIIDSSNGETVTSGIVHDQAGSPEAAGQAVLDWEREHGLIPGDEPGEPAPEPAVRDLRAILADLDAADHRTRTARELRQELEDAVRARLAGTPDADELAAEADRIARTTAPPVPGVTVNPYTGHVVYAVIRTNHVPGEPADDEWAVAAVNDEGEHATWKACVSDDGSGRLHYDTGHYHTPGQGADSEALADLANRAGVFTALTGLTSGTVTHKAFTESHSRVMDELEDHGAGRARVRAALLEAAALGYATFSWHRNGQRHDYGIRYDRYRCTYSWHESR